MATPVIIEPTSEITTVKTIEQVDNLSTVGEIEVSTYLQNLGGPVRPTGPLGKGEEDKGVAHQGVGNATKVAQSGVHIASMPCPLVTDSGNYWVADLARLANIGIAWAMYIKEKEILDMKMDIANQYYELAREMWDHFLDTYVPCEIQEVAEVSVRPPEYEYDYDSGLYGEVADIVFARAEDEFLRLSKLYCLCPSPGMLNAFNLNLDAMRGDMVNFSYRGSEAEYQAQLALWWNRRLATMNRGRDLLSTSAKYTQLGVDARESYNDLWRSIGQGATMALSYYTNRQVTAPYQHTTPVVNMEAPGFIRDMYGATSAENALRIGNVNQFNQTTTQDGFFMTPSYF